MNIKRIVPLLALATAIAAGAACSDAVTGKGPAPSASARPASDYKVQIDEHTRAALDGVVVDVRPDSTNVRASIALNDGPTLALDATFDGKKIAGTLSHEGSVYRFELWDNAVLFHTSTTGRRVTFYRFHDDGTTQSDPTVVDRQFRDNLEQFPYRALTQSLRAIAGEDAQHRALLARLAAADTMVSDGIGRTPIPTWIQPSTSNGLTIADGTPSASGSTSGSSSTDAAPTSSAPPDAGECNQTKNGSTTGPALNLEVAGGLVTLAGTAATASLSSTGYSLDNSYTIKCMSDVTVNLTSNPCYYVSTGQLSNSVSEHKDGTAYAECDSSGYVCASRVDPDKGTAGSIDVKWDGIVKFHADACNVNGDAKYRVRAELYGEVWACKDPSGNVTGKGGSGSVRCMMDDG